MPKGYLIFHLNLAFSSIAAESRPDVINKCYWPLLDLIENTGIPIGVELTGWTLQQIERIDNTWIEKFRYMLHQKHCELIGSGWSQIIGPLVPAEVNCWNQKLGLDAYQKILDLSPNIALVNEMAFSTSMVDIYAKAGYQGIIMDRDNVRLALDLDHSALSEMPTHALGCQGTELPVLWSDSILFQRLQRVIHGDIPIAEYMAYIKRRTAEDHVMLPIYCNDAEIFDYRPGRFNTESNIHPEGEWRRFERILNRLPLECNLEWVSPSLGLQQHIESCDKKTSHLSSIKQPIPVKKQAKYNINRWAVSGRNDLWLNTHCYKFYRELIENNNELPESWRELCELWASDLRTHITEHRWQETIKKIKNLITPKASSRIDLYHLSKDNHTFNSSYSPLISKDEDGILWTIETDSLKLKINVRRGINIHSLAFKSHEFEPVIGTLAQGYFNSIELGADFYSGGVLIEIPEKRARLTDLEWVTPKVEETAQEILILVDITFELGILRKTIIVDKQKEHIRLQYEFNDWLRPLGSVRVGKLTLLPDAFIKDLTVECRNGGTEQEVFALDRDVDFGKPASMLVSCSSAFGCTDGVITLGDSQRRVILEWHPDKCAAVAMLQHVRENNVHLTRLWFSLAELDDTARPNGNLIPFTFTIKPQKIF